LKDFRLALRAEEAAEGCPVRNAAESFFFVTFLFCGKKESKSQKERKIERKRERERKIRRVTSILFKPPHQGTLM